MRAILWISKPLAAALRDRLGKDTNTIEVRSASEFLSAPHYGDTVAFVDDGKLAELDRFAEQLSGEVTPPGSIVGVVKGPIQAAIGLLPTRPWLSHVISETMIGHPMAADHLRNVMSALADRPKLLDWVGHTVNGRRVKLTRANRRVERLERLGDFFASKGFSTRIVHQLRDAAEELLTNAFYDAPVAAGAAARPIPRTRDVSLPNDCACELLYGCSRDIAVVRVRDPFGALSRDRIVSVLSRCARTDMTVEVDESMGGAGLGLWRIFAVTSFVAINVVRNHHTDVLVGIAKRVAGGQKPFGFHFFFNEGSKKRRHWTVCDDADGPSFATQPSLVNE